MPEPSQTVTIVNKKGLHARASGQFARLAGTFSAKVTVASEDGVASGISIMDLLMLTAHKGSAITISTAGADEAEALDALVALVEDGFGELADE